MMMMHLIAAGFLAAGEPARLALSCLPPPPLCDAAAGADLVFFGEVIRQTTYPEQTDRGLLPQGIQAVRFKIIRAFKGVEPTESWGLFYFGVDARPFTQGERYLVFAHRRATGAYVTGCTLTQELTGAHEQAWLRTEALELEACFKPPR